MVAAVHGRLAAAHARQPGILDDEQPSPLLDRHGKTLAQLRHALRQRRPQLATGRVLGNPGSYRDGVRTAEGQKSRRLDDPRVDLQIELHPGSVRAIAGRAAQGAGTGKSTPAAGVFSKYARVTSL